MMINDEIKSRQILLSILEDLNGQVHPHHSICWAIENSKSYSREITSDFYRVLLLPIFYKWEGFSGSVYYPVRHPFHTNSGYAFMITIKKYGGHGLWEGEYGENRRALLNFCIAELNKEIRELASPKHYLKIKLLKYKQWFFNLFK